MSPTVVKVSPELPAVVVRNSAGGVITVVSSATYVPPSAEVIRNVFGSGISPFTLTPFTDGTPYIRLGSTFYSTGLGKESWKCKGGRIYVPASSPGIGQPCTVYAYKRTVQSIEYENATVTASAEIASCVAGWNEVTWTPFSAPNSQTPCFVHIAYQFGGTAAGLYHHAPPVAGAEGAIKSVSGVDLYLNEEFQRSEFAIGTSPSSSPSPGVWYGTDIIIQES